MSLTLMSQSCWDDRWATHVYRTSMVRDFPTPLNSFWSHGKTGIRDSIALYTLQCGSKGGGCLGCWELDPCPLRKIQTRQIYIEKLQKIGLAPFPRAPRILPLNLPTSFENFWFPGSPLCWISMTFLIAFCLGFLNHQLVVDLNKCFEI